MPNPQPPIPPPKAPTRQLFDPWNSSSTGHQRAENRLSGSTSWRASRGYKLAHQFSDSTGGGGEGRVYGLMGAGSEHFGEDGSKENGLWEKGAPGLREQGWQHIRELMGGVGKKRNWPFDGDEKEMLSRKKKSDQGHLPSKDDIDIVNDSNTPSSEKCPQKRKNVGIFFSLTVYVNGSTAPLISDHKLKQLLVAHGANISIALGRRTVTHVILGTPSANVVGEKGAGGGLAATKIQKEIQSVRGKGIKFVGVEWVLDSIKAGHRLPEAAFSNLHLAPRNQKSVYGMFERTSSSSSTSSKINDSSSTVDLGKVAERDVRMQLEPPE